ncbi:stalk domain-containing protein [Paenibacillus hamazuiensis]|uniref:stalk domain-containing protein n=1 Tax=Paenibacillus hamazuiensis TaxID=2936508 RepID=UPI00200F007F|nr:stalk domain-containing protein [Paenibacillus hamazuiensis]
MNIKRSVPTLLVGLLVSLLISGATCYACSCIPLTFEQKVERAEQVFIGKVVGIWHSKQLVQVNVEFEVSSVYKGDVPSFTHVYSSSAACGISFQFGKSYLVFKDADGTTSLCSGTGAVNDEKPLDESLLGKPVQTYEHNSSMAVSDVKLRYHHEKISAVRIDPRNKAVLPLRDDLLKELGIERTSHPDDHEQIKLAKGNKNVTVITGSNILILKNGPKYLDTISFRDDGIVYAPLRDLMEELDFSVIWNDHDRSVTLKDNNAVVSVPLKIENFGKLENFQKNVNNKVPDNMRVVRYSIDSGPIYMG